MSRGAAQHRRRAFAQGFERSPVDGQLVAQLHGLGVRLVELGQFGAGGVDLLLRPHQALVLHRCALGQTVDLRQLFAQRIELALLARQLAGLGHQDGKGLGERVGPLLHRRQRIVLCQYALHACFRFTHCQRQRLEALVEGVDLVLLHRQAFQGRLQVLRQRQALRFEPRRFAQERLARRVARGQFLRRGLRQLLHASQRFFGALHLLVAGGQLGDLRIHGPHHLVQAGGLDDRVLDRVLLGLERLGLVRHVLGERVERRQPLLGAHAQFLQLRERLELGLHLTHGLRCGGRVGARVVRAFANIVDLLLELGLRRTQRFEFALQRGDAGDGLSHFCRGVLQLRAQFAEVLPLVAQSVQRGVRLGCLRSHRVHHQPVLLQFAIGGCQCLGYALGLGHLVEHLAHALLELVKALCALVESGRRDGELLDLLRHAVGLLSQRIERLARARDLGRCATHLRQQCTECGALAARLVDQRAQIVMNLLAVSAVLENGVQHRAPPPGRQN